MNKNQVVDAVEANNAKVAVLVDSIKTEFIKMRKSMLSIGDYLSQIKALKGKKFSAWMNESAVVETGVSKSVLWECFSSFQMFNHFPDAIKNGLTGYEGYSRKQVNSVIKASKEKSITEVINALNSGGEIAPSILAKTIKTLNGAVVAGERAERDNTLTGRFASFLESSVGKKFDTKHEKFSQATARETALLIGQAIEAAAEKYNLSSFGVDISVSYPSLAKKRAGAR